MNNNPTRSKDPNNLLVLPKQPTKICPDRPRDTAAAKCKDKSTKDYEGQPQRPIVTDFSRICQNQNPKCANQMMGDSQNSQQQQDEQQQFQENKQNCNRKSTETDICSYLEDHYINRYRKYENYLHCKPQTNPSDNNNNQNTMPINSFVQCCELNKQKSDLSSSLKNPAYQTQSTINTNTLSRQQSLDKRQQQQCPPQLKSQPCLEDLRFNQPSTHSSTRHFLQGDNNPQSQLPRLDYEAYSQLKDQQDYYNVKKEPAINAFKRSCRIVLCIVRWRRFSRNTRLQRQQAVTKNQTLDLLVQAVGTAMEYSSEGMKSVLQRFFNDEESILDYYMHTKQARLYNIKYTKLKAYVIEILDSASKHSVSALTDDNDMIRFLNMQIGTFQFLYEGLYPRFILERLEFSDDTRELRNIIYNQRQLIALFFYIIYGLLNRLVDPWRLLEIQQDKVKQNNAQLLLSVIFYLFHDFMKILVDKGTVAPSKNYPAERSNPLYAYPRILESAEQFTVNSKDMENTQSDIDEIINEFESQAKVTDNIIIGLNPRHLLVDILERDQELRQQTAGYFREIAQILIQKIDTAPPPIKSF